MTITGKHRSLERWVYSATSQSRNNKTNRKKRQLSIWFRYIRWSFEFHSHFFVKFPDFLYTTLGTYMVISCRFVYLYLTIYNSSWMSPPFRQASHHESTIHGWNRQGSLLSMESFMICLYILRNDHLTNIPTRSLTTTLNLHIFRGVIKLSQTFIFRNTQHFF